MKFYYLQTDEGKINKYASGVVINNCLEKTIYCEHCKRTWKKDTLYDENVYLQAFLTNDNYSDFALISTTEMISKKAKEVLETENVKNYHLNKIDLVSADKLTSEQINRYNYGYGIKAKNFARNPPEYFKILIDSTVELHVKSEVQQVGECDVCGFKEHVTKGFTYLSPLRSLYFKLESWDGSDIFKIKNMNRFIFSERFYEIYKKHKLTGLYFGDTIEAL